MKKIILLMVALPIAAFAQAKKTAPKKSAASSTTSSSALTNADANNFIRYTNSISNFLENSFITTTFKNDYEVLATNLGLKDKSSYNTAMPQIDVDYFKSQYENFNNTFRNASNDDYVALDAPPAKMGADRVGKFKTALQQLGELHTAMASHYNNTLMPLFPKSLPKKKNGADEQAALAQYKSNLIAIENKKEELYTLSGELGEMAEAITLAKHPLKNEIIELRSSLKIGKDIAKLSNISKLEDYATNKPRVGELVGKLKQLQAKYSSYNTNAKENKEYAIRNGIKEYYQDNVTYLIDAVEKFETAIADKAVNQQWIQEKLRLLHGAFEGMVGKYESIVEMNNR